MIQIALLSQYFPYFFPFILSKAFSESINAKRVSSLTPSFFIICFSIKAAPVVDLLFYISFVFHLTNIQWSPGAYLRKYHQHLCCMNRYLPVPPSGIWSSFPQLCYFIVQSLIRQFSLFILPTCFFHFAYDLLFCGWWCVHLACLRCVDF